jgi:hypothetical protein
MLQLEDSFAQHWISDRGYLPLQKAFFAYQKTRSNNQRGDAFFQLAVNADGERRIKDLYFSEAIAILGNPDLWIQKPDGRTALIYLYSSDAGPPKQMILVEFDPQGIVREWRYIGIGAQDFSQFHKWE